METPSNLHAFANFRGDGQARPKDAVRKEKPVSHIPDNLWTKCSHCGDIHYTKEFVENFNVVTSHFSSSRASKAGL
ncbi:MAG: hypothetical protein HYU64_13955 [Armatimonadetes bacterium]|nr:hypothetical protein [Armatimonadota bacterium]